MFDNILFDLDGTLTDPGIGITNSMMYALDKIDVHIKGREELYRFIGPPLINSFRELCNYNEDKANLAVKYYREYFSDKGIFENTVYNGIEIMLKQLKLSGKKIILATSKPEIFAKRILEHFSLAVYFDVIEGSTLDTSRNTKTDVIAYALGLANITDKSHTVMIGDRKYDITGAKENGLKSIGVLYGYGDFRELSEEKADFLIHSVSELTEVLLKKEI